MLSKDPDRGGIRVKFWRFCDFLPEYRAEIPVDLIVDVPWVCVCDELVGDRVNRRKVRVSSGVTLPDARAEVLFQLGKFTQSFTTMANIYSEQLLGEYLNVPILPEVDGFLCLHLDVLMDLYSKDRSRSQDKIDVPVMRAYFEQRRVTRNALYHDAVNTSNNLTYYERAMVCHWLHDNLGEEARTPKGILKWMCTPVSAHAYTLYTCGVRCMGDDLQGAFNVMMDFESRRSLFSTDPERETLERFEEWIFSNTDKYGDAGLRQWGLDSGDHQHKWDPYDALPAEWVDERALKTRKARAVCILSCKGTTSLIGIS